MNLEIEQSWKKVLAPYFERKEWNDLTSFLKKEYREKTIYPESRYIFNACNLCPFDSVKVVILGQDPYHGKGQAHGLAFSAQEGVKAPPSLRNIFKELEADLGIKRSSTDLSDWAEQGVLLLNSVLSVQDGMPGSHAQRGWEDFSDIIIKKISDEKDAVVFVLWGAYAQKKGSIIDTTKHHVLQAPHPSPLSSYRGFFGSKPFSHINKFLSIHNINPITW